MKVDLTITYGEALQKLIDSKLILNVFVFDW